MKSIKCKKCGWLPKPGTIIYKPFDSKFGWKCPECSEKQPIKFTENKMKKDYLDREEVYEGLRKIGEGCPTTKRLLREGFPGAFKNEQKYCCDSFYGLTVGGQVEQRDHGWVVHIGTSIRITGFLRLTYCPYCPKKVIPPID